MVEFELLHPDVSLGCVPSFLSDQDQSPAREQFNKNYHFGGWRPFDGFELGPDNSLCYRGDPPLEPLAQYKLRDELIIFYSYAWVAIIQPDGSFEVCRMD